MALTHKPEDLKTFDSMPALGAQPSLEEQALLGAAKAHRSVVYSHYDYRNFDRGGNMPRGKVGGK